MLSMPNYQSWQYRCLPNPNTVGDVCVDWRCFFDVADAVGGASDLDKQDTYEDILSQLPGDLSCSIGIEMHSPEYEKYISVKDTDFYVLLESQPTYHLKTGEKASLTILLKEDEYFSFSFVICAVFVCSGEFVEVDDMDTKDLLHVKNLLKSYFEV